MNEVVEVDVREATATPVTERVAHLVLKAEWPLALCGALVSENLYTSAPAMDRCADCLKIAAARNLGRPGWRAA